MHFVLRKILILFFQLHIIKMCQSVLTQLKMWTQSLLTWFCHTLNWILEIGPSGVRALPFAAGRNVGGHYKWHFFSPLSLFRLIANSHRRGCRRVPKFCMGSQLTKILGFQPTTKHLGTPPTPRTMKYLGGQEYNLHAPDITFMNRNITFRKQLRC